MEEYKLVVVGGGSVGKSALTIRYLQNYFISSYDPTIDENYRNMVVVDNKACLLDILDTGGQEDYSSISSYYIDSGDGFLLIYSIIDKESFEEINEIAESIKRVKETDSFAGVLCGNKCDLEKDRAVERNEGYGLALSLKLSFFETSAKTTRNIENSFHHLVRMIRKLQVPKVKEKKKCSIL
ncbi:ras-like protein rasb [Anaeramoeba flamelloides]|uniref:small monomeric GTPase n=1 Tax=Anaeramoeba flamelloides TaxID=1746091 RepID=A0AAV8AEH5_9EUKA|nr:ras-like protein rasb [Anaeramoeba flamelloides]KAJ6252660.1 ras-like protein rasb [Anaeramoeba flamelloides]